MSLSMYDASVPVLARMLGNLRTLLSKGAAHAQARKFEPAVLVNSRLFPDMFPLSRQVQIATDMAKGCAARLAAVEVPKYEDNEASIDDLVARIDKTIAFIQGLPRAAFDGSETRKIVLPLRTGERQFDGQTYLLHFVLPNVYFHITTAYNLLRHNGVEIGKMDYLGAD